MGLATIWIPKTDKGKEMRVGGLSDAVAISYGTLFARTLSEEDGFVVVTLQSGSVRVIGHDTEKDEVIIGRLIPQFPSDNR